MAPTCLRVSHAIIWYLATMHQLTLFDHEPTDKEWSVPNAYSREDGYILVLYLRIQPVPQGHMVVVLGFDHYPI